MEKERGGKMIAIVALMIGVVGLTIGFAAFSNTLTISSSAEYNPSSTIFNVDFSSSSSTVATDAITPTLSPATNGPTGTNATINNASDPTITNIKATFTEPGQSVTYTFYVRNAGEMEAFLRSVTFADATIQATDSHSEDTVGSGFKTCTQLSKAQNANPATISTMTAACEDITFTMTLGSENFTASKARAAFTGTHDLDTTTNASETVTITIAYPTGSDRADGDFTVNFGDITLLYASTAS